MHYRITAGKPWPRPTGPAAAATYVCGVLLFLALPAGLLVALWADPWGRFVALTMALSVSALVALLVTGLVIRAGSGLVLECTDGAVVLPGSRLRAGLFVLSSFAGALFLVSVVAAAIQGGSSGSPTFVVLGGLVLLCGVPAVWALTRGRYRLNLLRLTPEQVCYRSYAGEHVFAWDDVVDVTLMPDPRARIVLTGRCAPEVSMRTRATGGGHAAGATLSNQIGVPALIMASGAAPIAELLDFYWRHPRLRAELGDGAVLDRVSTGHLQMR